MKKNQLMKFISIAILDGKKYLDTFSKLFSVWRTTTGGGGILSVYNLNQASNKN